MSDVTGVVVGQRDDCIRAIGGEELAEIVRVPSLASVRDCATRVETRFLWLLESGAKPRPKALAPLLDAGVELAASLPVDDTGRPVDALVGRFTEADLPALLRAIPAHRLPLRHTYVTSLLAGREAVLAADRPDPARFGRYAGSEWTSRLFSGRPAMLVPASRVGAPILAPARPVHALRMARSGVWGRGEALRELSRSVVRSRAA